ncbi:glycine-rich RNA-binding protein 3, mitochondrial-like [Punica granatum]|uniref:Glycine-rich RNA-binding protein 3, mitochondrial-like n=2 Tax=Punica granatum TaxID=22663 RepID=A0A6P8BQG9_PUNGR|nr:glycine-rich RNA-binding protein 3, mitochondrial-like [Punica granatum]XP_031372978.1 glycine-rich RNA-binding protein 3, mitochondrial-like [Punica granatum]PKI77936.1 hypothetical protein CRG98_001556 [Punica granatum]
MAFFSKVGNILKQTASRQSTVEISASKPFIFQVIRCMSSSKLFVGGLSYGTDQQGLTEAFSKYGEVVEARVISDRETGRSRGFGFITYTSSEEASSAIQALDGQDLHGRRIRVNYATDRQPRFGGQGFGYGGNYGPPGGGYDGGNMGYGGGGFGAGGGGYNSPAGGDSYGSGGSSGGNYGGSSNYGAGAFESGSGGAYGSGVGNFGVSGGGGGSDSFPGVGDGANDGFGVGSGAGAGNDLGEAAPGGFSQDNSVEGNFRDDDEDGDFAKRA